MDRSVFSSSLSYLSFSSKKAHAVSPLQVNDELRMTISLLPINDEAVYETDGRAGALVSTPIMRLHQSIHEPRWMLETHGAAPVKQKQAVWHDLPTSFPKRSLKK